MPDPLKPGQVVAAVAAGPAVGAGRLQQPAPLVQTQALRVHPDQIGGHRDPVHLSLGPGMANVARSLQTAGCGDRNGRIVPIAGSGVRRGTDVRASLETIRSLDWCDVRHFHGA